MLVAVIVRQRTEQQERDRCWGEAYELVRRNATQCLPERMGTER